MHYALDTSDRCRRRKVKLQVHKCKVELNSLEVIVDKAAGVDAHVLGRVIGGTWQEDEGDVERGIVILFACVPIS